MKNVRKISFNSIGLPVVFNFNFSPDAYTEDDIIYKWNLNRTQGIEVVSNHTAQFILLEAKLENTTVKKIAGASTIWLRLTALRKLIKDRYDVISGN